VIDKVFYSTYDANCGSAECVRGDSTDPSRILFNEMIKSFHRACIEDYEHLVSNLSLIFRTVIEDTSFREQIREAIA
jgi:hypothetical protein